MRVVYDSIFLQKLKKVNIRVKKSVKEKILIFAKNPYELELHNHELQDEYLGYNSIDITNDYRAIYKKTQIGREIVAYFEVLGSHDELYRKSPN